MAIGTTQGQSVDPRGIDQGLEEFVKGRGGMSAFIPGGMEKGLAGIGGGEMRDALTAAQDTYYNELKDRDLNNPFSLSESEQGFIDNFDNRGDDRTIKYDTPAVSDDGIGYDFSSPPPVTGIQPSIASSNLENVGASFDRPIGNPVVPPGDPATNPLQVVTDPANDASPNLTQLATDGLFTSPNVWNQSASSPITGTADQMANRQAGIDATARYEAQGRPSGFDAGGSFDRLGDSISNWWENLTGNQAKASGGPVALSMPLNQPPATPPATPPGMSPGGMGGSLPPPPAPPPSSSGSVSMPTQGMTQEDRPVPPGLMQTLLNRMSGKDPANPFTGNPPAPSSGSVKMPTSGPGY